MDRDSPVQLTDSPSELLPPVAADADEQGERLRRELLAAAEEEAAAIVENARSEITTVVRRARRDLLLIRAQLQLCGVEPTDIPVSVSPGPWIDDPPAEHPRASPGARRILTATTVIAAGVLALALFVTGGVMGWSSAARQDTPVVRTEARAPNVQSDQTPVSLPVPEPVPTTSAARPDVSVSASRESVAATPVGPPPARPAPAIPPAPTATAPVQPSPQLATEPAPPLPVQPVAAAPAQLQPSPTANAAGQEQHADILARHAQWLDAYARGDRAALRGLTTEGFSLRDERPTRDGAPMNMAITPAQLSDVNVDVAGVGAVLSARVRATVDGVVNESLLSEVWVRGDQQQWTLMGVRITPVERDRSEREQQPPLR